MRGLDVGWLSIRNTSCTFFFFFFSLLSLQDFLPLIPQKALINQIDWKVALMILIWKQELWWRNSGLHWHTSTTWFAIFLQVDVAHLHVAGMIRSNDWSAVDAISPGDWINRLNGWRKRRTFIRRTTTITRIMTKWNKKKGKVGWRNNGLDIRRSRPLFSCTVLYTKGNSQLMF